MKQTEAAKKIVNLWPQWPYAVGENLSDDALRFVGWLKLRHPEVLDFRSGEAKLGLIVSWLSADRAITESYRRGELLQEHLSVPAQPCAVNGFPMRARLRKSLSGAAAARPSASGTSGQKASAVSAGESSGKGRSKRKAKAGSSGASPRKSASGKKAKAGVPAAKSKSKTPPKKRKAGGARTKSQARSSAGKSAKKAPASKSKKGTSAGKSAKRRSRA